MARARIDQALTFAASQPREALRILLADLQNETETAWLLAAQALMDRAHAPLAAALLEAALLRFPQGPGIRLGLATALWHAEDTARAEKILREAASPDDASVFLLAELLRTQGKLGEAAALVAERSERWPGDADMSMRAAQFVRECQRQDRALAICERALAPHPRDTRLLSMAGNLAQELGRFDAARAFYVAALDGGVDLNLRFVLNGLVGLQRYDDRTHADFSRLEAARANASLTPRARAAVLFAYGKACEDIGDFAAAAGAWREANALTGALQPWSRSAWRAFVAERVARKPAFGAFDDPPFTPVFIVGMPRTGTTLVAELLARHASVRNRGESPVLPYLAKSMRALPESQRGAAIAEGRSLYLAHLVQDDEPAAFYLDKNPLNVIHLDLIAEMFANARVIECTRGARDTALSIWSQTFANDDYAFASDFDDIAALMQGCTELVHHARHGAHPAMLSIRYEDLIADEAATLDRIAAFIGLDRAADVARPARGTSAITSASFWQARQPVYARSVGRWRNYASLLPELIDRFEE